MEKGISLANVDMPDNRLLVRSLVTLLSLTSDAVLVFDAVGRIVLGNTEAERLFGPLETELVGSDVRELFPVVSDASDGSIEESLPFPLDGSSATVVCKRASGDQVTLRVRCDRLRDGDVTYLLVAYPNDVRGAGEQERERLVSELSRANKRLSGTLRIVLGTLDSSDVGMLFDRVLVEISDTLGAWATLAYVADNDGFRLRGGIEALGDANAPVFVPYDHPLAELGLRAKRPMRLRVMRPLREDLRRGVLTQRCVVVEESFEEIYVAADFLAPFPSFVLCPVWFGGRAIAMFVVGWRHEHGVADDDLRLLEAVAEYLSVQLAGAFAAMRAQHAEHLDSLSSQLRERLMSVDRFSVSLLDDCFEMAAQGIEASRLKLVGNPHQRTTMAKLADGAWCAIPFDLASLAGTSQVIVADVREFPSLVEWLEEFGFTNNGVLISLPSDKDACRGYLLLRHDEMGPFEEEDLAFIRTFAEDLRAISEGMRARTRDKHISQALQRGMRNELQHVEGITAESFYCSATEEAYVGGDFYDLIRLPERRACVIMGDVSGKGVEAASVSSAVKTALGAYAWEGVCPARMVSLLNDFLTGFSRIETFATLFVGIFDLAAGTLTYCSAGHPPALLVRAESGELVTLGVQSPVVGAFNGMVYKDGVTRLESSDVLLLYTDGTTEARNAQGAFFGEDGLRDAVARESAVGFAGMCERILKAVEDFAGGTLGDDVALLAIRIEDVG